MSNKRRKTEEHTSERLELVRCIGEWTKAKRDFVEASKRFSDFEQDALTVLDQKLEEKRAQLAELELDFQTQKKNSEIAVKQSLAEFKREGAIAILKDTKEVPIDAAQLESMRAAIEAHKAELEQALTTAVAREQADAKKQLSAALHSKDLEHKAAVAKLEAKVEQQEHEITALKEQVLAYSKEVEKQRELTKQVAEAARAAPISQNIGKQ